MSSSLAEWFAVLPGATSAAQRATARLQVVDPGVQVLARRDGKPWIVGRCLRPVTVASVAGRTAALIGTHELDERQLLRVLSSHGASGAALVGWAGSYQAVVATGEQTWVCGDVSGMRPVFWARIAGVTVFGDHARLLAQAAGGVTVDLEHLALHLLGPVPPLALAEGGSSPYQGVRAVPPGSAASATLCGRVTLHQWWTVPDDDRTLAEAAPVLREALRRAVAVRVDGEPVVGCELSGGADSSALSALAFERVGTRVLNFSRAPADPGNDDIDWARRLVEAQQGARHEVVAVDALPAQFAGMEQPFVLDAPSPSASSPQRSTAWWRHVAKAGPRVLLSGKGGDETMLTPLSYLSHTRLRDRPTARRHVRGWAALWSVPARQVRTQATSPGPYGAWLAGCLNRGHDERGQWEAGPYLPPWLSESARTMLIEVLNSAAEGAEPLHDRPHQHTAMAAIRAIARWNRLQADAAARLGIQLGYPYADQQVIEAALATRAEARTSPYQNKPLLTAAMRGIVPAAALSRRTKGSYSADTAAAVTTARGPLRRLLEGDCQLALHGMIDVDRLRHALAEWDRTDERTDLLLHLTVMCEIWARTANNRPLPLFTEASC
ncbi:asparagine synthase [Streptomyces sp. AC563]|uniref:asparagine synthase n=1 Tax=Streptomyces buecherae TaxID=2763006 RepID=UPI00164E48D5|nr:asparagine synthase [Streptomyces buecherae]MBC3990418.1 asparagine synthase [Streptomyces buecherae]